MLDPNSLTMAMLSRAFRAHPWHGIPVGAEAPRVVTCYIEIVPTDTVKFELDKETGHLRVDRPQRYSNVCPSLYGFVPQTWSGPRTAEYCNQAVGRTDVLGDGDPVDICVLTERNFSHGDVVMRVVPIGGFRMIDDNEADDKIIAVLQGDPTYGPWRDISECPHPVIERLRHYFLTYKNAPEDSPKTCEISRVYGVEEAHEVIRRAMADYDEKYRPLPGML
jgi:inorganic pyrophosphatase